MNKGIRIHDSSTNTYSTKLNHHWVTSNDTWIYDDSIQHYYQIFKNNVHYAKGYRVLYNDKDVYECLYYAKGYSCINDPSQWKLIGKLDKMKLEKFTFTPKKLTISNINQDEYLFESNKKQLIMEIEAKLKQNSLPIMIDLKLYQNQKLYLKLLEFIIKELLFSGYTIKHILLYDKRNKLERIYKDNSNIIENYPMDGYETLEIN